MSASSTFNTLNDPAFENMVGFYWNDGGELRFRIISAEEAEHFVQRWLTATVQYHCYRGLHLA